MTYSHPHLPRRTLLQAGSIGLLGLGMNHVAGLRAAEAAAGAARPSGAAKPSGTAKSVIYIFLSGGLSQHDSLDMKPDAPDTVRGEFNPISTATPGIQICEHLPLLAARSQYWALVRSLTHSSNEHSAGHQIMLSGRSPLPPNFSNNKPQRSDWPSIAAIASAATVRRNNLPPAAILPERLVHWSGRIIPGQFAGQMGPHRDPWFIEASPYHNTSYGAYPTYKFDHQERGNPDDRVFQAPSLTLPQGLDGLRLRNRNELLAALQDQREDLDRTATQFDGLRQRAISLLTDNKVTQALDVTRADDRIQNRYGKNSFGWSLLMARRLIECGVNLVQVNLGNDETWDTHGEAFPHLKNKLFPPTDRALSALLDDLADSGLLDDTLIVMAGEFGRTPKISKASVYKSPGRDHWGAVQTVFFAGGGVQGGQVIGSSDRIGAYPASNPQTPENMAATIYDALGIPAAAVWHDEQNRPHSIYYGEPILGLT
ncbi:MAG TPA: DUF1501 domain-containing protein [Pirellulaceae bacterium]|jgi:hypothetical protein